MKTIDLEGCPMREVTYPYLSIMWHKSKWELYCYRAFLFFEAEDVSNISKVEITCELSSGSNGKNSKSWQKKTATYLKAYKHDRIVSVPIDCPNLLKALVLNEWTKSPKSNARKSLVGRAKSIGWSYAGKNYLYSFLPEDNKSPAMLCEPYIGSLDQDEKIEIKISLKSLTYTRGLFDF